MKELSINLMRLRKLNGLTQQDIAQAAGISRVAYRNLEKGDAKPRENTLQALAKALNTSALELLAPVPELQSLRFRANAQMTEQERAQGDQLVARSANWLQDFNEMEAILGQKKQRVLKPALRGTNPQNAAAKLRQELLGEHSSCGCVPDICELLEKAGIKICLCDFNLSNIFGFSIGETDGGPAMAINTGKSISVERQIFSVAHELGHLVLHRHTYGKDYAAEYDAQEREADSFASEFLIPMKLFSAEWNENRGLHWIDAVLKTKRHFKVSYQTVLHRLIDMGKAKSPDIYKKFRTDYQERYGKKLHWKEEPPSRIGDEPRHLDPLDLMENRLGSLVRDALDAELITVSRAAEILDINIDEMRGKLKSWRVIS